MDLSRHVPLHRLHTQGGTKDGDWLAVRLVGQETYGCIEVARTMILRSKGLIIARWVSFPDFNRDSLQQLATFSPDLR